MDKSRLKKFKQELVAERTEVEREIKSMSLNQLNDSMSEATGELSTYDNHPADLGSEMFERSKDLALREGLKQRLGHIDDALFRMKEGNYGICESCGQLIEDARLAAIPSTTLCKHCKEESEAVVDRNDRPVEEDIITPPFGGFKHDFTHGEFSDDDLMYDGEDAWQEVARYGTSETPQDLPNMKDYQEMTADADEDRGNVDDVDGIPYFRGADGVLYEDFYGKDDESAPEEVVIGDEGWDRLRRKKQKS